MITCFFVITQFLAAAGRGFSFVLPRPAVGRRRSPVFGDNLPTAVPSTHYPAVDYPVHVTETSKDKIDLETMLAFILD